MQNKRSPLYELGAQPVGGVVEGAFGAGGRVHRFTRRIDMDVYIGKETIVQKSGDRGERLKED